MNSFVRKLLFPKSKLTPRLFKFPKRNMFQNFNKNKDFIDKDEKKNEEYFEVDDNLQFINGKFLLSKSNLQDLKGFKKLQVFVLTPINLYLGYKLLTSVIFFRPLRAVLWGVAFLGFTRLNYGFHINLLHFVDTIYLLEGGTKTEFVLVSGNNRIITENINIRKPNQKEIMFIMTLSPSIFEKFVPLLINNNVYFLSKDIEITNKPLFAAVMNGNYIRTKKEKNDDNVIDIK